MRWSRKNAVGRKPKNEVSQEGLFSFTGGVGAIVHVPSIHPCPLYSPLVQVPVEGGGGTSEIVQW